MPNRIIKESINESAGLSEVSFFACDLYKRLITYADDYGRFNADSQIMLARLYPREIGIVSTFDIEDALTELVGAEKVAFYTAEHRKEIYGCFPNWSEHQRVRDSKKKFPDPDDTSINDWYLRRFVPIELKTEIIERDGFKCQECGKYICVQPVSAYRLVKMATGMFHIDHIVPVCQGGRATLENLRLLCPTCNLTRRRRLTTKDLLNLTASNDFQDSPQSAAIRRKPPQVSAVIQSEYESESNKKISPIGDTKKRKRFSPPTPEMVNSYCQEKGYAVDGQRFCDYYASKDWVVGKSPMKDWQAAVRTWASKEQAEGKRIGKQVGAQQYGQRKYTENDLDNGDFDELIALAKKAR